MKTRQQRLNEARAGRPPSPPQSLSYNQRGPKRTRAKPSATVAAGSVVPAAQSAVQGEAQSLLYVWVDFGPDASSRPVNDPTHKITIPSASIPTLIEFAKSFQNQDKKSPRPAEEEEHLSAMGATGQDEAETNKVEVQEQTAERTIRPTSQTPDPTNKNKRKRGGNEVGTHSPKSGAMAEVGGARRRTRKRRSNLENSVAQESRRDSPAGSPGNPTLLGKMLGSKPNIRP